MNRQHSNPFVVSELKPQRLDGSKRGVYQLTAQSAHPTRIVGRDEDGMPVEDTIPTVSWRHFVMPSGCINKVPIRTSSASPEDDNSMAYEQMVTVDLITAGAIPLAMCPYSTEYTHITRGPFVKPQPGEEACAGDEANGGCSHMKALMERRKAKVRTKHEAEVRRIESMKNDEIERMQRGIVAGVGEVMAKHLAPQDAASAARNRLRTGKGEADAG